jgi:hypothetical protein
MFDTQKVLDAMRISGPTLPAKVAKLLSTDTIMASAVLSDLASFKKIKISYIKVGSSPLYYLPGQEHMLQNFKSNLNEKDQRTLEALKQRKIIRDREADPLTRVSLREIRDFAVPLNVNLNGQIELFWKWHLITNEEADAILKSIFEPKPKQEEQKKLEPAQIIKKEPEQTIKPEPIFVKEEQKIPASKPIDKLPEPKEERRRELKPKKISEEDKEGFTKKLRNYFAKKEVTVLSETIIKKNEANYTISIPSPVGELQYYCVAKDKKKITEVDLDAAFCQGQLFKLPVLLLTTGELNKKAQERFKELKSIILKKI